MKHPVALVLFLSISPIHSLTAESQKNEIIESAHQFQHWCKTSSYRYFRQRKLTPYNWAASTVRELNDYQTTGSWKVENQERTIFCQIKRGRKAKYMDMAVSPKI